MLTIVFVLAVLVIAVYLGGLVWLERVRQAPVAAPLAPSDAPIAVEAYLVPARDDAGNARRLPYAALRSPSDQ